MRSGLQFGVIKEAAGKLEVWAPCVEGGGYCLVNELAVAVTAKDHVSDSDREKQTFTVNGPAEVSHLADGVEQLRLVFLLKPFKNNAHVRVLVVQRSDRPEEIGLEVEPQKDSVPLQKVDVTAVSGHIARLRLLWFPKKSVNVYDIWKYPSHSTVFTTVERVREKFFQIMSDGSARIAFNSDDQRPWLAYPVLHSDRWHFPGRRVTEYWRVAAKTWAADLTLLVQALQYYPGSKQFVFGGLVYERLGIQQSWMPGQIVYFGTTLKTPQELGYNLPSR